MRPKTAPRLSSLTTVWRPCPQCNNTTTTTTNRAARSFTSTCRQRAFGPEHPRYIEIPEPPQQSLPYRPPVKGILPVPRNVFAGTPKDLSSDEQIALSTQSPKKSRTPQKGSREEWKAKMSEMRKQNLREGLKSLKARRQNDLRTNQARSDANKAEREARLLRPEREDERLTAPSNNLDLEALYGKAPPDPNRQERLERKRLNFEAAALRKQEERMDALHTLYMNARDFIVTPQQLDKAVDDAFGTQENPVKFASMSISDPNDGRSIWAQGTPMKISDMLKAANNGPTGKAIDSVPSSEVNKQRIRRIAEVFTNGKMDNSARQ